MAQPLLRRQPFKGAYLAYLVLSTLFVRVPLWYIWFLPRSNRPKASWPLSRCIRVMLMRELTGLPTKVGLRSTHDVPKSDSELKDAKFVWVEGLPENADAFCGEVRKAAETAGVKTERVPTYWYIKPGSTVPQDLKAKTGEITILHIHGGAFHLGTAHPDSTISSIARGLLAHSKKVERILAVDYRLSATAPDPPANPFPAAVLDSLAAYQYLVKDVGFEPQNIIVAGDSAGGNIAFALVRHLVENAIPGLAPPGRLLSLSSWLDLSSSRTTPDASLARNFATDIFSTSPNNAFGGYGILSYLGPLDREQAKTNRYLSPCSPHLDPLEGLFKGFPPTFVSAGGAEKILDDSLVVADRLKADGVPVTVDVVPDAVHDFMVFTWHEPERTEALKRVGKWLDD
ncbi:alpha/beta-hydrolase [Trametes versicolor FP-101664 SS1]|uniref:Alpha/beta-hydrolase n=1 Tax=Trametes versicolor (strain FP-101664) TaxID=717944 RepID=R7S7S4_TRAVS|nr:alpha/beta-hydrolase [Trametes versicolor FP-101664 SS1]EIW51692.1 alpha/beta-hydrolase [Trametes versicolor FP-101664 SS1]